MKRLILFALPSLFLSLWSCRNDNFVVRDNTLCNCNSNNVDDPCSGSAAHWQQVVSEQQEVSAFDFKRGNFIGTECQGEVFLAWDWPPVWFNSWRPVDGFKHTLSATLHHFNWNYNDDEDWNLHCVPSNSFQFLINDVEALHSESSAEHNKCGNAKCMEAEISPDKKLWENPWFFAPGASSDDADDSGYSWLEGRQMCFFGPWIMDANHDFKSEIHPAEMIWWKDHFEGGFGGNGDPFDIFWLMLMQDNTGRFDDRDNFDCDGDAPSGWKPWSDSPVSGQFNIAFEVDPNGPPVHFEIVEIFNRSVVTSQDPTARPDADNGTEHALEYNGKVLVTVKETQPNDDDLGVTFTGVCKRPNGKLQGFVSIRSAVGGNDDKDEEGFHVLYVVRRQAQANFPGIDQVKIPDVVLQAKVMAGSVTPDPKGWHNADLQLNLTVKSGIPPESAAISKVELIRGEATSSLAFRQDKNESAIVQRAPTLPGSLLKITFKSGKSAKVRVPALALTAAATSHQTGEREQGGSRWAELLRMLKIDPANAPTPPRLLQAATSELSVLPAYGIVSGSESEPEHIDPAAEVLNNAIIKNDGAALEKLFLSARPFSIKWTFKAVNLATGTNMPVSTANTPAPGNVIAVQFFSRRLPNDSVSIIYPRSAENAVIECEATATISDGFGHQKEQKFRCWNHQVSLEKGMNANNIALLSYLGGIKEPIPGKDNPAAPKSPVFTEPSPKDRQNLALQSYFQGIVRDKTITVGEITALAGLQARRQ